MNKVVLTQNYHSFQLDDEVKNWLVDQGVCAYDKATSLPRHHPKLVQAIQKYCGECHDLFIVEIEGNRYVIHSESEYGEYLLEPKDIKWVDIT